MKIKSKNRLQMHPFPLLVLMMFLHLVLMVQDKLLQYQTQELIKHILFFLMVLEATEQYQKHVTQKTFRRLALLVAPMVMMSAALAMQKKQDLALLLHVQLVVVFTEHMQLELQLGMILLNPLFQELQKVQILLPFKYSQLLLKMGIVFQTLHHALALLFLIL